VRFGRPPVSPIVPADDIAVMTMQRANSKKIGNDIADRNSSEITRSGPAR
jgi:hypothetical protein